MILSPPIYPTLAYCFTSYLAKYLCVDNNNLGIINSSL